MIPVIIAAVAGAGVFALISKFAAKTPPVFIPQTTSSPQFQTQTSSSTPTSSQNNQDQSEPDEGPIPEGQGQSTPPLSNPLPSVPSGDIPFAGRSVNSLGQPTIEFASIPNEQIRPGAAGAQDPTKPTTLAAQAQSLVDSLNPFSN